MSERAGAAEAEGGGARASFTRECGRGPGPWARGLCCCWCRRGVGEQPVSCALLETEVQPPAARETTRRARDSGLQLVFPKVLS